jgi:hypothetical protein
MKKIYLLFAVLFVITCAKEEDPIKKQNKETMEKDYEASFPGLDK